MKKLFITVMMILANIVSFAQNYDTLYIVGHNGETIEYCTNSNDGVIVYGRPECPQNEFLVNGQLFYEDFVLILNNGEPQNVMVLLTACATSYACVINYKTSTITNPFVEPFVWKRIGKSIVLYAPGNVIWSTGETENEIEVTEPGTYSVTITDVCGSETFSIEVRDNVELYRATVDLATNLNKVTWQTTPEQAEYISQVKVERDGMVVGTAQYEDGQFIDNIGSENAARNYRLTGIDTDGNECPIPSYQKGTLHVDYSPNASNPNKLNMAWTPPFIEEGASISVSYFQICKYDPATGEVTVVDQIGANNTIGSYDVNLFDGGYATVAALFSEGKDYEDVAFSNLTDEVLGVDENAGNPVRVYPNPAQGRFRVEGTGTMHITNALGQEIMAREIDGKETIVLPQGIYFVRLNGTVRKIVVE